jgi:hypothetical protein
MAGLEQSSGQCARSSITLNLLRFLEGSSETMRSDGPSMGKASPAVRDVTVGVSRRILPIRRLGCARKRANPARFERKQP